MQITLRGRESRLVAFAAIALLAFSLWVGLHGHEHLTEFEAECAPCQLLLSEAISTVPLTAISLVVAAQSVEALPSIPLLETTLDLGSPRGPPS
ncbi:MAG: hypothetical protein AAF604_11325 [Acidobacteriota bacterium]